MEESKAEIKTVVTEETKTEEKKPEETKPAEKKPEETKPDNLTATVTKIKADYEAKLAKQYTELQSQIKERDNIISQLLTTEKKETEQPDIVTSITNKINAGHVFRKW